MSQEIGERGDGAAHGAPPNHTGRSTAPCGYMKDDSNSTDPGINSLLRGYCVGNARSAAACCGADWRLGMVSMKVGSDIPSEEHLEDRPWSSTACTRSRFRLSCKTH